MDLESLFFESFVFEQFDGQFLVSILEFLVWGYFLLDFMISKEQLIFEEVIFDDINVVFVDSWDQGIFYYIEDEIIQLLVNEQLE